MKYVFLQAEQMHKMTSFSLKIVKIVILSENIVVILSVAQLVATVNFSQLEIIHVFNEPTAKNKHKYRGPELCTKNQVHL